MWRAFRAQQLPNTKCSNHAYTWASIPLSLWSIPLFQKKHVTKSLGKAFPLYPPKFLMTNFLAIDRFPGCKFPIIPSYFPRSCSMSPYSILLNSSFFQMFLCSLHWIFFPLPTCYISFPSKLKKPFVSTLKWQILPKMGMKTISASFFSWDGRPWGYINHA